jgi:hypothetical protein
MSACACRSPSGDSETPLTQRVCTNEEWYIKYFPYSIFHTSSFLLTHRIILSYHKSLYIYPLSLRAEPNAEPFLVRDTQYGFHAAGIIRAID